MVFEKRGTRYLGLKPTLIITTEGATRKQMSPTDYAVAGVPRTNFKTSTWLVKDGQLRRPRSPTYVIFWTRIFYPYRRDKTSEWVRDIERLPPIQLADICMHNFSIFRPTISRGLQSPPTLGQPAVLEASCLRSPLRPSPWGETRPRQYMPCEITNKTSPHVSAETNIVVSISIVSDLLCFGMLFFF